MFPNLNNYMKAKHGNLPHVEVTRDEFIKMMMDSGLTKEKAESQAVFCQALGSHCMIGEQMVGIKEDPPVEEKKDG